MTHQSKKLGLGLVLGCTLVFPGYVLAGGDHKDHKAGKAMGMEQFQKMDSNADGKLSPEEHSAGAKSMFATMDADKDGKVTALEMESAHDQMKKAHGVDGKAQDGKHDGKHAGKMDLKAAEKIKVVDTNADGVLSAEEHTAGATMMFTKMDTDKDGFLSKEEMAKGHAKMLHKKHKD